MSFDEKLAYKVMAAEKRLNDVLKAARKAGLSVSISTELTDSGYLAFATVNYRRVK